MTVRKDSLLLVIPSVVLARDGAFQVEKDFAHNLESYSKNFQRIVFACPALNEKQNDGYIIRSVDINEIPENVKYIELPYTYREDTHLLHYFRTRKLLRGLIDESEFLLFSPHAPFDWPTLAAREAIRLRRKFDIECDLDWNNLMEFRISQTHSPVKRTRLKILAKMMRRDVDFCLASSSLALLQGKEVFEAYRPVARNPHMVLNVQVAPEDRISDSQIADKLRRIRSGAPLKIVYAGRITERKGALDWVKAIRISGAKLSATWLGDGPDKNTMIREADGLSISLPGVLPREAVMKAMRQADIFLFCHKVAESPRCLSEALASGVPIIGYRSAFPEGLVETGGGGGFVELGDWQALGSLIAELDKDRDRLASLVLAAASTGRTLDRDTAMQNRIDLIKKHLST